MSTATKSLLRFNQRQLLQEEKAKHERQARDPHNDDRAAQHKAVRNISKMLADQSPAPITGIEKDKLASRVKELGEKIRGFMLPREEMRRSPTQQTNAVYQHLKNEGNPESKRDILEWKNGRIQLDPDSDDPNLANADYHLRPEKGTAYSGLMVDAMGPKGHMAFQSPKAQANFEQALPGSPTINTPLKQAQRRVAAEQKPKQTMSAEARQAASERMKARHAARRQSATA